MERIREHYGFPLDGSEIPTRCASTNDFLDPIRLGLQAGDPMLGDCYSSKACVSNPRCAALGLGGDCCPTAEGQMLSCCEE